MSYSKDFTTWFSLKPKLHTRTSQPPVNVRDIWWCSIGTNVGEEINANLRKQVDQYSCIENSHAAHLSAYP
jgi:hypothetical protein